MAIMDQIRTADIAIRAAEDLGMTDVAAQIIAKRAQLVRQERSPVEFRVTYHVVPQERMVDACQYVPTDLPILSPREEIDWFTQDMEHVTVRSIRWGDPHTVPFTRGRIMLTGTDPVTGSLVRGYIYCVRKERGSMCPTCGGEGCNLIAPGLPCPTCSGTGRVLPVTISEVRSACGEFDEDPNMLADLIAANKL